MGRPDVASQACLRSFRAACGATSAAALGERKGPAFPVKSLSIETAKSVLRNVLCHPKRAHAAGLLVEHFPD